MCKMLKRLFLAGTITFPLYLLVYLDGMPTPSARLQPKLTQKVTQVASELKEDISQIHQDLWRFRTTSTKAKNF
ncbi:hypothetical protein PCC7424_3338 [Gloeothece citriformis PCC 7424]|uniref:Uncharacterized protein n=1 Tax=Gloeothece citriformis (strain PCC 7424) TaxID=65393 RepID=B7KE38_GLOC7|nr:hypothetical protein PCC7424_3338 [Gloeothece citriformis PCC 7424]